MPLGVAGQNIGAALAVLFLLLQLVFNRRNLPAQRLWRYFQMPLVLSVHYVAWMYVATLLNPNLPPGSGRFFAGGYFPAFGVKPDLELGTRITIRGNDAKELLIRLLAAVDNTLKRSQMSINSFSFGIKEYIEIPGIEYQREIGIKGLNVTVVFIRAGVRVKRKKIKSSPIAKKQNITEEEIIKFMKENFKTEIE